MIPQRYLWMRWPLGVSAIGLMLMIYIFQRKLLVFEFSNWTYGPFILNRLLRLLFNDALCLILFIAVFNRSKELKLATYVFLFELLIVFPVYLAVKLQLEGPAEISMPLLSFVHRLIVNPLLMFILLAGLLYQHYKV